MLGVEQVGIYDDFFELGGHSLLAGRLMKEIEKELGQRIPLVSLFKNATVASLAEILNKDVKTLEWPTLVEIQPGGSRLSLFCVSTPNVNALGYRSLARHLGEDQPVYGLQAQYPEDLDGEHSQAAVEDLATAYLKAMRAVRPEGPYQLMGLCRGAHIAYEMARRLEVEGQKVAMLGVLDTWVLENTYTRFLYLTYYARRLRSAWQSSPRQCYELIYDKARKILNRSPASTSNGTATLASPLAAYWPGSDFKPKMYGGDVSVFRVRHQPLDRIRARDLGWSGLTTGEVEVIFVPGKHGTVLSEPHVKVLAEELGGYLQQERD